jgi:hypothetical protein
MVNSAATETGAGMTAQDWLPGLEADEESEPTASRRRRSLGVGAGAVAAVIALAAVVFVAHRLPTPPATSTAPPSNGATDAAAPTPQARAVMLDVGLSDPAVTGGYPLADLIVGTQPLQGGSSPDLVPNFDSCQTDADALQYLPVQIRTPENWLSGTFTVQTTTSTPPGLGRLGFFFQAGYASTPCPDGVWSTSDSFEASNLGQAHIIGYVVLDQAFTASTPQGRPDVFSTLQLRVSNIRFSGRLATLSPPTVGSLCPGTEDELCASLG